ncbi:hypothetical protein BDZ94DRAFT_1262901 [Collybia nuda]|uniref:F-box domain-containing protein n=1 Tax=Collybia nuda TaxID=64659 RepID=A0A9P6CGZ3_9AGAR|nr:hypothetical protein BDZ94DRAFT_1262901 [Collybia nuda]
MFVSVEGPVPQTRFDNYEPESEPTVGQAKQATSMNLHYDTLPPEIWLKIFPELPAQDLHASTLTCSSFRSMAQPLLFTIFDVSPFFLSYTANGRIHRPRKYLDRTLQRLRFYRSKHIAPAVKHCWISPYSRTGYPPRNHRDYLEPNLIIDAVIEALPAFVNLTKLSWHCTDFTADWWNAIHHLPIKSLWLNSCTISGEDLLPVPVKNLDLDQWAWEGEVTNRVSIHEELAPGVSTSILSLILHAEHIQNISVPREDTGYRILSAISDMATLTRLHSIRIPFAAIASPCFVPALIQCPTLEELRIFTATDDSPRDITIAEKLPSSCLPALSVYEGPSSHLLSFAAGRPLKSVSLWGLDESPALCDPTMLLETLLRFSVLNHTLENLQLSISRVTLDLLNLLASFPQLKTVSMESADNPPASPPTPPPAYSLRLSSKSPINILYILLQGVTLPPNLTKLRIATKLQNGNLDSPTQEREASKLIEGLAQTYPALTNVEIMYGTYWTGTYSARWSRLSSLSSTGPLGKLSFKEHRRTIVFPIAQVQSDTWRQEKDHGRSFVLFSAWIWLRQVLYRFL